MVPISRRAKKPITDRASSIQLQVVILLILVFNSSALAQQGWVLQKSGTNLRLESVCFTRADTGIIVGAQGIILRTIDKGNSWNIVESGVNDWLFDVDFNNAKKGIAVGGYFGSSSIVVRTSDGGVNWNQSSPTPLLSYGVSYTGNAATIVGYLGVILRSTDHGQTWIPKPSGIENIPAQFNRVSFIDADTGIVIGGSGTIIRTENGGDRWDQQESHTSLALGDVHFHDTQFGIVAGDSGLILRTTNGGNDWLSQESGVDVFLAGVAMANADTGYAVGNSGIILRTIDGGLTWEAQQSGCTDNLNDVFCISGKEAFIVGNGGNILFTSNAGAITEPPQPPILVSPGNGAQDISLNPKFDWESSITATSYHFQLATDTDFIDLVSDSMNLEKTSVNISDLDYETSYFWRVRAQNEVGWSSWSSPVWMFQTKRYLAFWHRLTLPVEGEINGLIADHSGGLILFIEGKIYRSTDNAESWLLTNGNVGGIRCNYGRLADIRSTNNLYCYQAAEVDGGPTIVRSADFGASWDTVLTFGYETEISNLSVNPRNGKIFISGRDYYSRGPFLSVSDDGDSWQSYNLDSLQVGEINTWGFSSFNYNYNFAGSYGYIIRTSEDELAHWEKITLGDGNGLINHILVFGSHYRDEVLASIYDQGIYRSVDDGVTWQYRGLNDELIQAMVRANNNSLFVGTDSSGVLISTDLGLSWNLQNDGLFIQPIRSIIKQVLHPYIFVQTDSQLYRSRDQFYSSVDPDNPTVSQGFYLKQNYPNPFNPVTTISYFLPRYGHVKLDIYTRLGQLVQTLVSGKQNAGIHRLRWEPHGLSSGVYFYKLHMDERVETKKLVYLK